MESEGFAELLRDAQAGDRDAMDRLLESMRPELERLALPYSDPTRPSQSTQDLVQDAWLKVWQKLDQFRGAENADDVLAVFRVWVGQIVHRTGLNRVRARKAQRRDPGAVVSLHRGGSDSRVSKPVGVEPRAGRPSPSEEVGAHERAVLVRAAVSRLPQSLDRQILKLRFFEGLSLRQIADRLSIGYDRVRERYAISLRWLERDLEPLL